MSIAYYRVIPLEPLVARDSRPIGNNTGRARSLDWLTPSVIAGAVRSALWREKGVTDSKLLKQVKVSGGFLIVKTANGQNEQLCFPRPQDALIGKPEGVQQKCYRLRPLALPEGCSLYLPPCKNNEDKPSVLSQAKDWFCFCYTNQVGDTFKPDRVASYWPAKVMTTWLNDDASLNSFCADLDRLGQQGARRDERVHVSIDPVSGTARDGILFGSVGLDFNRALKRTDHGQVQSDDEANVPKEFDAGQLSVRIDFGDLKDSDQNNITLPERFIAPVGGDRHLAEFVESPNDESLWQRPHAIPNTRNLRLILATPALFKNGWLPGWIGETTGKGTIPGTNISVSLVSANAGRWKPISGWSYEDDKPKPLRRMVPEGSVYFFKVDRDLTEDELKKLWLCSVCDDDQDRSDGFGLALWGSWNEQASVIDESH